MLLYQERAALKKRVQFTHFWLFTEELFHGVIIPPSLPPGEYSLLSLLMQLESAKLRNETSEVKILQEKVADLDEDIRKAKASHTQLPVCAYVSFEKMVTCF